MSACLPACRIPLLTSPINEIFRWFLAHSFPPHITVRGYTYVRKDRVAGDGRHRVRVRLRVSSGCNTKISCLGIDRVELAILGWLDPRNVIAHSRYLPAIEFLGWDQHCKVCFSTCARKCRRNI